MYTPVAGSGAGLAVAVLLVGVAVLFSSAVFVILRDPARRRGAASTSTSKVVVEPAQA